MSGLKIKSVLANWAIPWEQILHVVETEGHVLCRRFQGETSSRCFLTCSGTAGCLRSLPLSREALALVGTAAKGILSRRRPIWSMKGRWQPPPIRAHCLTTGAKWTKRCSRRTILQLLLLTMDTSRHRKVRDPLQSEILLLRWIFSSKSFFFQRFWFCNPKKTIEGTIWWKFSENIV